MGDCSRTQFLKNNFPAMESFLEETGLGNTQISPDSLDYLNSKTHTVVLGLAASHSGTSYQEVEKLMGELGRRAIDDLIDSDLLQEADGRLISKSDIFALRVPAQVLNLVSKWIDVFDYDSIKKPGACSYSLISERLNEDGLAKINEIERRSIKEKLEVIRNQSYHGDTFVFSGSYSNIIDGEAK